MRKIVTDGLNGHQIKYLLMSFSFSSKVIIIFHIYDKRN